MSKSTKQTKYWFKRRRYGYGWTPSTWQGWTALAVLLGVAIGGAIILLNIPGADESVVGVYTSVVLVLVGALIILVINKGPAPKWRWGKQDGDNPNEDF